MIMRLQNWGAQLGGGLLQKLPSLVCCNTHACSCDWRQVLDFQWLFREWLVSRKVTDTPGCHDVCSQRQLTQQASDVCRGSLHAY